MPVNSPLLYSMKENTTTSFFFEEGEIFNDNYRSWNPQENSAIYMLEKILRPAIEQNKLSGKIELTVLCELARISYLNVEPLEFVPALMDLIRDAD